MPEELTPDPDALETLRRLVEQIQGSGYRDKHGHPIENNIAFRDAAALVKLTTPTKDPQ